MKLRSLFYLGLAVIIVPTLWIIWVPVLGTWITAIWAWPPSWPSVSGLLMVQDMTITFLALVFYFVFTRLFLMWSMETSPDVGQVPVPTSELSRIGLFPAFKVFDEGAAAGSKFFIGLMVGQVGFILLSSNLNIEVLALIITVLAGVILYLIGTSIHHLLQSLGKILRSPVIDKDFTLSSLMK